MAAKISFILLLSSIILASCLKPQEFPFEPIITFKSFTATQDSGVLVISFTDGDGDIGLRDTDTTGDFKPTSNFHHNLFIDYYEKDDLLGWVKGKTLSGEDIQFLYRIPYLTPNGNNTALKGEIEVTIEPSYFNPLSSQSDTVKFKITLADRSLKVSNTVESSVITR